MGKIKNIGDVTFYFEDDLINPKNFLYCSSKILDLSSSDITEIKSGCFENENIDEIRLPIHLRTVRENAFENCSVRNILLGNIDNNKGKKDNRRIIIQSNAFINCNSLEFLLIKSRKIIIEKDAFFNCPNLTKVIFYCENVQLRKEAFSSSDLTIYAKKSKNPNLQKYCFDNNITCKEF